MKNYVKLVDFELKRFMKIYLALIGIVIISQIVGVIVESNQFMNLANGEMLDGSMNLAQFLETYWPLTMSRILFSRWFILPVGLSAAALIFYCFFIWYRDWFGKNTFIYRLLMLPTARINILLAKASAIFLMVLGLVSIQLILLPIENIIFQTIVPFDLRVDMTIREIVNGSGYYGYLQILLPTSIVQFFINYGIGFMTVFTLFTAILFERSYRIKGIIFGVAYCIFALVIFLSPFIIEVFSEFGYFYPEELFIIEVILGIIVTGISIWVSHYLLNRKVTV
ncbi:hypothetical protein NSA56_10765 [Oceanobacillus caeni]|uniref:ABC transporter permease n=1 Tax=Oceanobacillus caeni TaxID=405946 RepID=A0ABR5MMD9_9BACI|nr:MULTISPECIES: hypothetical protein [Bacillaceae]KKE78822.1 hypothetical protein WH51_10445 [Bacilli bacterium VT-13-104]PZD85121.1 hypothetical protein DEJ64_10400 [Bacilli bacterium]KPH77566.1 hypothetical protein AFL42_02915 [Oceanobacillus caeni]MBU8791230.1 hypothetical protein [Oceanobacillus caeni]MCR1834880.1 hypothetical protein [Oceanobacillus caeni]